LFLPEPDRVPTSPDMVRWRQGVSFAVSARRGGKISEDIAVPLDSFEAAVQLIEDLGREVGLPTCSWGHAGDGNLHATFMIDARSLNEVRAAEKACESLFERTLALGGTVSGE